VRELQNIICRAVVLSTGPQLTLRELPRVLVEQARDRGLAEDVSVCEPDDAVRFLTYAFERLFQTPDHLIRAADVEDALIRRGLDLVGGNVTRLSRLIGLSRATLYRRISQMGGP
jgi:transcriptional regulator of acetoin/glycerol metabolism